MSLLPLPTRLPARKHVLAAAFSLLGLAVMAMAVMTASGLTLPFTSGDPARVRAGSVLVDAPTTTTTAPAQAVAAPPTTNVSRSRALDPVAVPGPTPTTTPPTTVRRSTTPPPTTSTTLPPVPPLIPGLGGLGQGGLGRG
jgi:hypothetical protein